MIELHTGLPGNGKTLHALWYTKNRIERENVDRRKKGLVEREIFYHGITNLLLPWTRIEPREWMDCPPGSVIVIDECQFVFERKPNGSKLPVFYEQLAVHRHKGFDIILITQHPSLIDNFVRKLVGKHLHIVRTFGMERAFIHEWASVRDGCEKPGQRKDSIKHIWKYPKEVYSYYKSAEQHTVKRNLPAKLFVLIGMMLLFGVFTWMILRDFNKRTHVDGAAALQTASAGSSRSAEGGSGKGIWTYLVADKDAQQFVFDHRPRVSGLMHTEPRYDEITKATRVPVPAACISNLRRCSCFTQDATPMAVPDLLCRDIVARGYFVDFDANGQKQKSFAAVDALHPDSSQSVAGAQQVASNVITIGDEDGYGVLGKRSGGRVVASK